MKKVLAICLMIVLVVSMSLNAFAAPNGFVSSPSGNRAPILIKFEPKDEGCTATIIITPYGEKNRLPANIRDILENAYNDIVNSKDLTNLSADLADLANKKNIDGGKLAISDLFDLSSADCGDHDGHKKFDITLDADALDRFVGLMYRDSEGKWHLIEDAKVVNGTHLQFTAEGHYPYAIIVDTTEGTPSKTGDSDIILVCAAVMAVSAAALAVVLVKGKKRHA